MFGPLETLIGLVSLGVWIWALVDCLQRRFREPLTKLIWVLVILFGYLLGALIYLALGRNQGLR